jgi:hypothetical protein
VDSGLAPPGGQRAKQRTNDLPIAMLLALTIVHTIAGSVALSKSDERAATLTDAHYHRGPWNANPSCPSAVAMDATGSQRARGSEYAYFNATKTAAECAKVCCSDWSCWGFTFYPRGFTGNNTARWPQISIEKHPISKTVDCADAKASAGLECLGDNLSPLGNFCDDPSQPCCTLQGC